MEGVFGKATLKDVAAIGRMTGNPEQEVFSSIRDYFVAKVSGSVVGCIAVRFLEKDTAEIRDLFVMERNRNCGIGSRLLELALFESRTMGADQAVIAVDEPGFFLGKGFVKKDGSISFDLSRVDYPF
ncbi:GNAT family N-acetyltransferase [Candidatus Woesearchaeota archaeon]|nr:GNAT family N-acetyltransferase [Candidatus Woesearchaeota archaeon]